MFGFVYLWTNKLDGMKYLGSHQGNIDDGYIGSGIRFLRAVNKHGLENFERTILYQGTEFRKREEELLKFYNAQNSEEFYNLKNESIGGSFAGILNGMHNKKHSDQAKKKISDSLKSQFKNGRKPVQMFGKDNPMFGQNKQIQNAVALAKSNSGKSYEEIHGFEKAEQIRSKLKGPRGKPKWQIVVCNKCGKSGKGPNMSRYHFDNCKF